MSKKIVRCLTYVYLLPLAGMVFFNIINSFLRTTYFLPNSNMETAKYRWDNPIFLLLFLLLFLPVLYFVWNRVQNVKKVQLGMVIWVIGISFAINLLFHCIAICDGKTVSDIMVSFMQGDYGAYEQGEYLYMYPFQIGFGAVLELIYRLFGTDNYFAFQCINILAVAGILWQLNCITGELFPDERIKKLEAVLSFGLLPVFLYTPFVYGDFLAFFFGLLAVSQVLAFLKDDKCYHIWLAGLWLGIGIIAKPNTNILVVALSCIVFLKMIVRPVNKAHVLYSVIAVLAAVLISQMGMTAVNHYYCNRAGLEEIPSGVPKVAWVAMGLQEGNEEGYACGWYNGYNCGTYAETGYDTAKTTELCVENIKESLGKFARGQKYTLNYFYKKFTSQWNAPTFKSVISCEWGTRHTKPLSPLGNSLLFGTGRTFLYEVMNGYHFLIFLGAGLFFVFFRKEWSLARAYLLLNIFGGFLFHMIWEAQARYVLCYFVLFLPFAAAGIHKLFVTVQKHMTKREKL